MLSAVSLDDKASLNAGEVDNIRRNRKLTAEATAKLAYA
jgi:hypothetical protein